MMNQLAKNLVRNLGGSSTSLARYHCFSNTDKRCCLPNLLTSASPKSALMIQQQESIHNSQVEEPTKTMPELQSYMKSRTAEFLNLMTPWNLPKIISQLPGSQDRIPPRRMQDSWDSVILPLSTDAALQEKYLNIHKGGIRVGRLMEDLDNFAGWISFRHLQDPSDRSKLPPPYACVTALVDHVDFEICQDLHADKDIKLEGFVSWVGSSSMEITIDVLQQCNHKWTKMTTGVIVFVARHPLKGTATPVNALVCQTKEEEEIFMKGASRKQERIDKQKAALFISSPNNDEQMLVHELLMGLTNPSQLSYSLKKPEDSVWMAETKLKNLIICFPENRNAFNKIFGGFLMRQAIELSYANATVYSGQTPKIIHIDDILFKEPVEIGSLLYLNSQVVYTEDNYMQISTKASVIDAKKQSVNLTNNLHVTFQTKRPVPKCLPHSYNEAMMYIDGRRHYKSVRGINGA